MGAQQREQKALGRDTALRSLPHLFEQRATREQGTELFGAIVAGDEACKSQKVGSVATGENYAPARTSPRKTRWFFCNCIRCRLQSNPLGYHECVRQHAIKGAQPA